MTAPAVPRTLAVVAGVLMDADQRVLLAQRSAGGDAAGLWEFAGGKIHPGEAASAALRRELDEELGIAVSAAQLLTVVRWRGAPRPLNLHSFRIDAWAGTPEAREHQQIRWVALNELIHYPMPAPDLPIRARLVLPSQYLITPEPGAIAPFLESLARALDQPSLGMISVRARSLAASALARVAEPALALIRRRRPDLLALIHASAEQATALGFDGAHLSSRELMAADTRPAVGGQWLLASCHDAAQVAQAQRLQVDAVVVGPVQPSLSHPNATALGWRRLRTLTRASWLPMYALGGVSAAELPQAQAAGAIGVAGIRAWWPDAVSAGPAQPA